MIGEVCAFCGNMLKGNEVLCMDHTTAKGCARFKEKMETTNLGALLKDMTASVNQKLDKAERIRSDCLAIRLQAAKDQIELAMELLRHAIQSANDTLMALGYMPETRSLRRFGDVPSPGHDKSGVVPSVTGRYPFG